MNFNNIFPYNQIHEGTIDDQKMIWFPKTYVRGENLYDGQFKGKYAWQVSEYPRPFFHVHRAFIDSNGHERDGFWLGKYEASNQNGLPASVPNVLPWTNISTTDAIATAKLRNRNGQSGWHIQNCFEYWFVSLLMMIELGTPDFCTKIGMGGTGSLQKCGSTNAVWRGLYEHWANTWEIVDGCRTDANKVIQLWDRTGEHYVSTEKVIADAGIARGSVNGVYFSDAFLPVDDGSKSTFSGTTSDGAYAGANSITLLGGSFNEKANAGGFTFYTGWSAATKGAHVGFRLAKY